MYFKHDSDLREGGRGRGDRGREGGREGGRRGRGEGGEIEGGREEERRWREGGRGREGGGGEIEGGREGEGREGGEGGREGRKRIKTSSFSCNKKPEKVDIRDIASSLMQSPVVFSTYFIPDSCCSDSELLSSSLDTPMKYAQLVFKIGSLRS